MLVTLTAVSTLWYPALHEDNIKNFAISCYNCFEDLLAPIAFAKVLAF